MLSGGKARGRQQERMSPSGPRGEAAEEINAVGSPSQTAGLQTKREHPSVAEASGLRCLVHGALAKHAACDGQ